MSKQDSVVNDRDFTQKLWAASEKLRSHMDAAEYKHVVLGLIFLKYISDAFESRRQQLDTLMSDPDSDYYEEDPANRDEVREDRDEYVAYNVFWVPKEARWQTLSEQAKLSGLGKRIDDAMAAIEEANPQRRPKLKGVLPKNYARLKLENQRLGELVDLISSIGFTDRKHQPTDVLGRVYEYFLGQFASAEGKRGGQFYTPACIVRLLVKMLSPMDGRIYDPCCGSGGMFIQSDRFVSDHGGKRSDISLFGQESNPTTWKLAAMNLAIHGIEADLGSKPGDTLRGDLHPDLKADHILANPPFNLKDWGQQALANDVRWTYGIPPASNANFAWLQHIVHHLAPGGMAGVVLANGAMSSTSSGEDATRRAMVEDDLIDCMVALPSQLFFNTQIPACLWFLTKSKQAKEKGRDRRGEVLFIDARKLGQMQSRVLRVLTDADIARITKTYRNWRGHGEGTYEDVPGFCKSASLAEIAQHGYVLTPGRYVGASVDESDDETFVEKMEQLTEQLAAQFAASAQLETQIRENLERIGYGW